MFTKVQIYLLAACVLVTASIFAFCEYSRNVPSQQAVIPSSGSQSAFDDNQQQPSTDQLTTTNLKKESEHEPSLTTGKIDLSDVKATTTDEFGKVHRDKYILEQSHNSFWVYYNETTASAKRPCVLVAAAGSGLFFGKRLGEDDVPEHLPYAEAGFVVIAYDVSGPLSSQTPTDREIVEASRLFKEADGGVRDGLTALAFAEKKYSFIDSNEVYVAGHSSAGTVALALAQKSPIVKGCVAYAPVWDPHGWVGKERLAALDDYIPGFEQFFTAYSPKYNRASLNCPVFIFHAEDDPGVLSPDLDAYVSQLQQTNKRVTHVKVKQGGHYDSMIDPGLSKGVSWLLNLHAEVIDRTGAVNGS